MLFNIMIWAGDCSDGTPGYALWHIFPCCGVAYPATILVEEGFKRFGDVIHSQEIYVNDAMLGRLYDKHNIRPHVICQRQGEAVFIPAGGAHQVCHRLYLQVS